MEAVALNHLCDLLQKRVLDALLKNAIRRKRLE